MATPFASYRGDYQVLPRGWMEAQMSVGDNYARAIEGLGNVTAGAIGKYYQNKELGGINRDAAQTGMAQLEQLSQVTGQPIDPVLTERYANLGQMNTAQSGQFVKDIQSAQQNALLMDRLRREKVDFDMRQQVAQKALQMQGLQQAGSYIDQMIGQRTRPQMGMGSSNMSAASMPSQNGASAPQALMNQFDRFGSLMPTVGTFQGLPMSR